MKKLPLTGSFFSSDSYQHDKCYDSDDARIQECRTWTSLIPEESHQKTCRQRDNPYSRVKDSQGGRLIFCRR